MDVDYRLPVCHEILRLQLPNASRQQKKCPPLGRILFKPLPQQAELWSVSIHLCLKSGFTPLGTYDKQLSELATCITGFR